MVGVVNTAAVREAALSTALIVVGIAAIVRVNSVGTSRAVATQTLTHATLPTLYASLLVLLSLVMLIGSLRSILRSRRANVGRQAAEHHEPAGSPSEGTRLLVRWFGTLTLLVFYALLLPQIHFLVLTTVFLALLFLLFGRRGWLKVAAASVLGGAGFYLLFIVFLSLPL